MNSSLVLFINNNRITLIKKLLTVQSNRNLVSFKNLFGNKDNDNNKKKKPKLDEFDDDVADGVSKVNEVNQANAQLDQSISLLKEYQALSSKR